MRLDSIDLIRFGHFCGQKIEFPARQPDFYLIYGDNEAGKSTLLRGISALLFGVPAQTPDVHSCKGSDLRIGATISGASAPRASARGGPMGLFADASGNRLSFRRRKGTIGTLLDWNDGQIAEDALKPFLRDLDRERFEQFFGLNHERLRQGGEELLRGQGDVGSALFQAAGLLELRRLLEKLDADAKEVFSPKSRTRTISRIIEEYRQAKAEIRRMAISGATVKEIQTQLEDARATWDRLKGESLSLQQDLVRLRRISSNKPDLARLSDLRTALAALGDIPTLPADAHRQFDEATGTLTNANNQINILTQEIAQREKRIQELPANSLLKTYEIEIRELNAGTSGYLQSVSHRAKRMRERDAAIQAAEADWKSIWPGPVTEASNLRNAYSCKEQILSLVAEHKGLTAELAMAKEELRRVQDEQVRLQEELDRRAEVADPAGLLAAIEQAKSLGDTDPLAAKLRSEVERLTKNAQREMRKLALWAGTIQELENLRTPLLTTIDQYEREWEAVAERRRNLSLRQENALETIRQKERELASLTSQVSGAGEGELAEARERRNELWLLIRASAIEKTMTAKKAVPLADLFAEHLRKTDEIADLRFTHARDVALHDRLVKEIASARADQERIEREMQSLETSSRELRERWNQEWTVLGATPLSPSEMKEWMKARQSVLDQLAQSRDKEDELEALQQSITSAAAQIAAQWAALGPNSCSSTESLPVLLRMAEKFARERENERRSRNEIQRELKSLSVERRRTKLEECSQRMVEWSQKWIPHVHALFLPETSTPDQATRALAVLEKVLQQLDKAEDRQHRVKTIGDDIKGFEARLSKVLDALGSPYASLPPETTVKQLHSELEELGNAETQRETLEEQNKKDREAIAAWRAKAQQSSASLDKLRAMANCKDGNEQQLDAAIVASEQKLGMQQEERRISSGLIERNGNADLAQIEEEASAYDVDSLQSEIADKEKRAETAIEEISAAARREGELKTEFERLETSEETALQSQRAEDALARLRPEIANYLRLRLASEVLGQAMDSYRAKHQGPILTRASHLFSRLTLGQHSGLTSDFGDDDKPVLVAIRRNGEKVHVDGLSDGTLDQLYLALRLAAIEDHVKTVGACPVIFDDILIHSDDARSSAALEVISDLAKNTQVLFFSHHKRLAELGVMAGAQVIEFGRLTSVAVA